MMGMEGSGAEVAVVAESAEAWEILRYAGDMLERFGVAFATHTLDRRETVHEAVAQVERTGVRIWIVGNTSTAPLSEAVAERVAGVVLAVPLEAPGVPALEALRAATRGGGGAPVASLAIGKAGATNAALLAVAMLANADAGLRAKLEAFRSEQTQGVLRDRVE
jgi:5-(carboxyamino)imidazole ribonucleotide mutase